MMRLKGGEKKSLKTLLKWQWEEPKHEQKNNAVETLLKDALKEITSKQPKSLDKIMHEEKNKERSVGEMLAKAYTWLEKHVYCGAPAQHSYPTSSSQPQYVRDKKKQNTDSPDHTKEDLHSPIMRKEMHIQTVAVAEQVIARQQEEYGSTLVTEKPTLEQTEGTYWWRMTNKSLKEFIYQTAHLRVGN